MGVILTHWFGIGSYFTVHPQFALKILTKQRLTKCIAREAIPEYLLNKTLHQSNANQRDLTRLKMMNPMQAG